MNSGEATGAVDELRLNIIIKSTVPAMASGALIVAKLDCEQLKIEGAFLVVDPASNRIALMSPCGCMVHTELSSLVVGLGQALQTRHPTDELDAIRRVH